MESPIKEKKKKKSKEAKSVGDLQVLTLSHVREAFHERLFMSMLPLFFLLTSCLDASKYLIGLG